MIEDAAPQADNRQAAIGLWYEISAGNFERRPALFLDRDGVVIEDSGFLARAEDMRMQEGAAEAIARCNRLGIPVVLVSNQSGIGRRLYEWRGFHAVQAALAAALMKAGGHLDAVFACAYHADGVAPFNVADHPWRKPNPGMIVAAGQRMKLDLARSWIVGDRASDVAAGRAAQLQGGILLSPRDNDPERAAAIALKTEGFAVDISGSLGEAVSWLLSRGHFDAAARPDERGALSTIGPRSPRSQDRTG
jgi:D-glycero-D-manno-heptose 1,7-bisphosphate phosphatase